MLSVVIPTFNRLAQLQMVLEGLEQQTLPRESFEVIVVSDGSTDGTDEFLSTYTASNLVHEQQANQGPAAARNRGVEIARGAHILFIDDDVVPAPDLLERHSIAQRGTTNHIVIGSMIDAPGHTYSPWVAWEQEMIYKQYRSMREGEFAPTWRQFYTGNASVARQFVLDAGGFDTTLRRAEDVELANRLYHRGATFAFDEFAIGYHHAERSFDSWIGTATAYGRNDVSFGLHRDPLWLSLAMPKEFRSRNVLTRTMVLSSVTSPRLVATLAGSLKRVAFATSRGSLHRTSRFAFSGLYALTYYAAAADEFGDRHEFRSLLRGQPRRVAGAVTNS